MFILDNMLVTFYNAVICSLMFGSACLGRIISKIHWGRLDKIVKKAGYVVKKLGYVVEKLLDIF